MTETTIGVSRKLKAALLSLADYPGEFYEKIIWRLVEHKKGGKKNAKGKR